VFILSLVIGKFFRKRSKKEDQKMIKKLLILTSTSMALVALGGNSSQAADDPCVAALLAGQTACIQGVDGKGGCEQAFPKPDEENARKNCTIHACQDAYEDAILNKYCPDCPYAVGKVFDKCQEGCGNKFDLKERRNKCIAACSLAQQTSYLQCPKTSTAANP